MRPISFFSAALCGVLCANADTIIVTNCAVGNCHIITLTQNPFSTPSNGVLNPDSPPVPDTSASANILTSGHPMATPSAGFAPPSPSPTSLIIYTNTPSIPPQTNPTATFQAPARANGGSNTGAIIGGVVGGLLGVALILGVVAFFFWRRRRRSVDGVGEFGTLEKSLVSSSPPVYTVPVTAYSPPPQQPQLSPAPPITAVESHHLMGGYSEPRHHGGGAVPAVSTAGYAVGNQREVDEDGVSLRSPSPVQDGGRAGERDSVPRLPIYNRGIDNTDRGPAL